MSIYDFNPFDYYGDLWYTIDMESIAEKYPDLKYQDASFKEYGYGATIVLL